MRAQFMIFHSGRWLVASWLLLAVVAAPGCAFLRAKSRPAKATPAAAAATATVPAFVGTVAIVNERGGFVLIDTASALSLPGVGTSLISRNGEGEESARLKTTPEHKRPFITADIVSGKPVAGDRVYQ